MSLPLLPPLTSLSLSLLLLISFHHACSQSSDRCPGPTPCGNITVSYPFSLYDPNDNETSFCGYPGLRIYCYEYDHYKIPTLYLGSDNYTITDLRYDAKTISLVDPEILLQKTSSPRIDHNVSLTSNTWLNYTVLVINITFFLDCPLYATYAPKEINPIGSIAGKHSYVFPTAEVPPDTRYWYKECKEVVVVPVFGYELNAELQNLTTSYGWVLLGGFQLEWSNGTESESCTLCEKQGGQCGYNVTSNSTYIPTCFCANGTCGTNY